MILTLPCTSPPSSPVFAGLQPHPVAELEHQERGSSPRFADPDCNILVRHEENSYNGTDRWVSLLDPETMDVVFTSVHLPSAAQDYAWVGDPGQHIMAITTTTEKGMGVTLVDLDTGSLQDSDRG